MSSAPRNVVEPVQPEPNPLNRPVQLDPFAAPSLEAQVDRDLRSLSMFRLQERADRLRGMTDPLRIRAAEQVVASIGDDFLLQKYGTAMRSFEQMQRAPQTKQEAEVAGIVREQEAEDAESPLRAFAFDTVAGVIGATQKAGIAAWEVAGTLADLTPQSAVFNHFFGSSVGDPIREIAQDYRDRVLSGESSDMPFLQEMNVRANRRGTWGVATGDLVAQALPSLGVALRSTVAARRVAAGLSWVFGTQAAGNGIEKYRREAIARGEQPSAGVAFMVGVGYAAAEYATENIDRVVPWQRIGAASAAKIGEAIVGGKANVAGRYLANAAGLAATEGLEEVIAGDLQSFVDMAAGSSSERTNAERLEEFVMGAAGAGVIVGAGSMLPSFRQAMQEPPTFLRSSGLDMKLADDARIWLNEEAGKRVGIEAAFMRATAAVAETPAGRAPVDVPAAVAEMEQMLRTVGEGRAVEAIPEEEQSAGMRRTIAVWRKKGIEVVPIRPDSASPIPASPALSQPGVVLVEMTGNPKVDEITTEVGLIGHETYHQMRQLRPDLYANFVASAQGPILAAARQYVDVVQAHGLPAHADMLLSDPDLLVEEGGALLFQQMIEHAGLTSTLSGHSLGMRREMLDFYKRTTARLGLRGLPAKATLASLEALQQTDTFQPVQPPADVLAGVPRPRFATRATSQPSRDPKELARALGSQLQVALADLDGEFRTMQAGAAAFMHTYVDAPAANRVNAAKTPRQLRKAMARGVAGAFQALQAEATKDTRDQMRKLFEDQIRMSRKVEALRDAKLGLARTAVVDLIRKAKVEGRHDLTARAMRATTPAQFQRVVDSLAAKIAKADAKKAAADAAAAKAKAAAAAEKEAKSTESLMAKNERAALAATISNEMERWGPQSKLSAAIFGDAQDRDKKLRRMVLKLFTYGHMKPWTAALYLFGEGKGREVFYDNLNAAANRRLGDYQADTDYLKAAIEAAGFKLGSIELAAQSGMLADAYGLAISRPGDLFHVKPIEHTVKASHKITYGDDRVLTEAEDIGMTSDERMEIQGVLWHKGSRDLILGGTPITLQRSKRTVVLTPQNVADLESAIPQWERSLALAVWERYNGPMAARLNAWSQEARGEDMAEANHWPRSRELEPKIDIAEWNDSNMAQMGMLQEKTSDKTKPIVIRGLFSTYLNHSWRLSGLTHLERPVLEARQVLSDIKGKAEELGNTDGISYFGSMLDRLTLEAMGHPGLVNEAFVGAALARLRNNVVRGLLGVNPIVAAYQIGGLISAAARIPSVYLIASMHHAFDSATDKEIGAYSPTLRQRVESNGIGLMSENASGSQSILGYRGRGWMLMWAISKIDHLNIRVVWWAAKMKVANEMPNATKEERAVAAAAMAESVIIETQPSFDVMHQSGVAREASQNVGAALLTMFTSSFSAHANLVARDVLAARRSGGRAYAQLARSMGLVVAANAAMVTTVQVLRDAILSAIGGDEGDERTLAQQYLDNLQQNTLNMVYGGAMVSVGLSRLMGKPIPRGAGASPLLDTLSQGLTGPLAVAKGIADKIMAETGQEERKATDAILSGLDQSVQGLLPLGGVPITPYRLGKKALGGRSKAAPRRTKKATRRTRNT